MSSLHAYKKTVFPEILLSQLILHTITFCFQMGSAKTEDTFLSEYSIFIHICQVKLNRGIMQINQVECQSSNCVICHDYTQFMNVGENQSA